MSEDVFTAACRQLFNSEIVGKSLTFVWHAGEPLSLPPDYYDNLFELLAPFVPANVHVRHAFQTNATLIDAEWCAFFKRHAVDVGVSLDGPAFLHDRHRVGRNGRGSHQAVMHGVQHLRDAGLPFHVIAVVTADSVHHPDALFDFFASENIFEIGFNFEETEGVHTQSSLTGDRIEDRVARFLGRYRWLIQNRCPDMHLREFQAMQMRLKHRNVLSSEATPFRIVSVDVNGNWSTFSPELLGMPNSRYGNFQFGSVFDTAISEIPNNGAFKSVASEISEGIEACRENCDYFNICGGGSPSNKLYETGRFTSTETQHCRLTVQVLADHLSGPPATPPRHSDGDGKREPIALPERLYRRFRDTELPHMLEHGVPSDGYELFVLDVISFLQFRSIPVAANTDHRLFVIGPAQTRIAPPARADIVCINSGETTLELQIAGNPVRLDRGNILHIPGPTAIHAAVPGGSTRNSILLCLS